MQEHPQTNQKQGFFGQLLGHWRSTALIDAVKNADVKRVQKILNQGVSVNSKGDYFRTPLHWAAEAGHLEVIKVLLAHGAAASAQDGCGQAPLHLSSENGHVEAMKVLLKHGADAQAKNTYRSTPLHMAAGNGRAEAANLLLAHQANLEAQDQHGRTPLHFAARAGHLQTINLLLEHGANLEAQTSSCGGTPLDLAAEAGHIKAIKVFLAHGANLGNRARGRYTPLHKAAANGQAEAIKVLLAHQANLEAKSGFLGETPLHSAAWNGCIEAIKMLLAYGADLEAKTNNNFTPLHKTAGMGRVEAAKLLVACGANLEAQNIEGDTPLHWAAESEQVEAIKVLVELGANLAAQNIEGKTPVDLAMQKPQTKKLFTEDINKPLPGGFTLLGIAASQGNIEQIKLLVRHGARLKAKDAEGLTAMQRAIEGNHMEAVRCLGGLEFNKHLLFASKQGNQELVEYFLIQNADINATDAQGYTPLLLALKHGHVDLAWQLIQKGADAKAISQQSETALHLASALGEAQMVQYLLENGADAFLKDPEGRLAIHRAAEVSMQMNYAFVRLILHMQGGNDQPNEDIDDEMNKGISADEILSMTDNQGNTVLHIAARVGNIGIIDLCREYAQDFEALLRINNASGQIPYEVALANEQDDFAQRVWLRDLEAQPAGSQQQPAPTPNVHLVSNDPIEPTGHNAHQRRDLPSATPTPMPTPMPTPHIANSVGNWKYRQLGNTNSSVYDAQPHKPWRQKAGLTSQGSDDNDDSNASVLDQLGNYIVGAAGQAASALLMYGGAKNKALGQ